MKSKFSYALNKNNISISKDKYNSFQVALVGSIYMAGLFFGSIIFGYLGDLVGRKWALMLSILCASAGSLAGAFVYSYEAYAVTRFITAIGEKIILNLKVFYLNLPFFRSTRSLLGSI